jgi:pseudaminic acid biosynthesis-associated methylase
MNQIKKWKSEFGNAYTKRNPKTVEEMDELHLQTKGITRTKLTEMFLSGLTINNALEVGCNVGVQLLILNNLRYKNLYGIEINEYAIDTSKENTKGKDIYIIKGSALDIPYKDSFFDLVFTSGLLIHISPDDINRVLDEIHRCSRKYIWCYEYYSDSYEKVTYRGVDNLLWKTDFVRLFMKRFKNLELIKEERLTYIEQPEYIDTMFLLEKRD